MERHPFNGVSFGFGVFFILAAAVTAFSPGPWWFGQPGIPAWVWPAALLPAGLLLLRPLFSRRRPAPPEEAPDDRPAPDPAPPPADPADDDDKAGNGQSRIT